MKLICSNCHTELLPENINITTNLGKCHSCDAILQLSELTQNIMEEVSQIPPENSNVTLESDGEGILIISLPKNGIKAAHLPMLGFAIIWLCAIGLFTYMSIGVDMFPVLFSIPFWAVGIFLTYGVIKGSQESQKITITKDDITVEHFRPFGNSKFITNISDIQDVTLSHLKSNSFSNLGGHMLTQINNSGKKYAGDYGVPTILSYANNQTFFENTAQENQIWITTFLKDLVTKMNNTN